MKKSLGIGIAIGLLALAFAALPAMASAAPTLVEEGGGALGVGETVVGTSTDLVTETQGFGNFECKKVTLNGEVTQESPASVAGGGSAEGCTAAGLPAEVSEISFSDAFEAGGTDTAHLTFVIFVPSVPLLCHYEGTGQTTWTNGSPTIELMPTALTPSPAGCPPGTIHGHLALETTSEVPVEVQE